MKALFIIVTFTFCLGAFASGGAMQGCFSAFSDIDAVMIDAEKVFGRKIFNAFPREVSLENKAFIEAARNGQTDGLVFLRVENKMMKLLNDSILKNKGDSYSVSMAFQSFFLEVLEKEHPALYSKIRLRYHDYKSLSLGIETGADLTVLDEVFSKARRKFSNSISKEVGAKGLRIEPRYADFEDWFSAGAGKTPDQAALAAKLARSEKTARISTFSEKREQAETIVNKMSDSWSFIKNQLRRKRYFRLHFDDKGFTKTLNLDIVNMGRKASDKKSFLREFEKIYPEVDSKVASAIYDYIESVDSITASVLSANTASIGAGTTTGIVYSVDIGQMGAEGFMQTMRRTQGLTNVEDVLKASREAFWTVDRKLTGFYRHIKRSFGEELGQALAARSTTSSGDDALIVFDDALKSLKEKRARMVAQGASPAEIKALDGRIAKNTEVWGQYREEGFNNYFKTVTAHQEGHRFRVVAVKPKYAQTGKGINRSHVGSYIEIAETFEKRLRKNMAKENFIGLKASKDIYVGIEVSPLNKGVVQHRLVVGNISGVSNDRLGAFVRREYARYVEDIKKFRHVDPKIEFLKRKD